MAGRKQLKAAARRVWAVIRRWPKLSISAFVIIFLSVVPVWPFFPSCKYNPPSSRTKHLYVRMSDEYRYTLKLHFSWYGIYYRDIGGLVLIRALPFLDGGPLFDQHDAIVNGERKAAWALADRRYINSFVGREINGKVYTVPAYLGELLRDILKANPGEFVYRRCDVMRVIVTGKPPGSNAER